MKYEQLKAFMLIALIALMGFNSYQLGQMKDMVMVGSAMSGAAVNTGATEVSDPNVDIIPRGVPAIYGAELGISFDDISADNPSLADSTIETLGALDNSITLTGKDLERYIDILYNKEGGMGCEYCCGAKSVIFNNGQPACGCAHSFAMRGLTKYLITKHGSEYTDDEILEEAGKLKVLFFPGILEQKAQVMKSKGIELNYVNLASNKYRGIEKGASSSGGSMVGGC